VVVHFNESKTQVVFRRRPWALALLRVLGWSVHIDGLPVQRVTTASGQTQIVSRGVILAYPHTSNWDGLIGWLTVVGLGLDVRIWGKASLFRIPVLGWLLRTMGAVPIERTDSNGLVARTVEHMLSQDIFWLGLAPEGTRKAIPGWRTGFYHLAVAAQVPLALAYLDWGKKRIGVDHVIDLSGDVEADMARIAQLYDGVIGKVPANAAPIRLLETNFSRADAIVR
jgi:1-acyl-sn-glycerol-3-phosphate acyltransferase